MGEIKDKSVRDILKEILAQDKNLLGSRDALVEKLDEAIPGALARDFNPIKAALREHKVNVRVLFPIQSLRVMKGQCVGVPVPELLLGKFLPKLVPFLL